MSHYDPKPHYDPIEERQKALQLKCHRVLPPARDISLNIKSSSLACFVAKYCTQSSEFLFLPWETTGGEKLQAEVAHQKVTEILKGYQSSALGIVDVIDVGSFAKGLMLPGSDSDHDIVLTLSQPITDEAGLKDKFQKAFHNFTLAPTNSTRLMKFWYDKERFDIIIEGPEREVSKGQDWVCESVTFFRNLPSPEKKMLCGFVRACKYWIKREQLPLCSFKVEQVVRYIWKNDPTNLSFDAFLRCLICWPELPDDTAVLTATDKTVLCHAARQTLHLLDSVSMDSSSDAESVDRPVKEYSDICADVCALDINDEAVVEQLCHRPTTDVPDQVIRESLKCAFPEMQWEELSETALPEHIGAASLSEETMLDLAKHYISKQEFMQAFDVLRSCNNNADGWYMKGVCANHLPHLLKELESDQVGFAREYLFPNLDKLPPPPLLLVTAETDALPVPEKAEGASKSKKRGSAKKKGKNKAPVKVATPRIIPSTQLTAEQKDFLDSNFIAEDAPGFREWCPAEAALVRCLSIHTCFFLRSLIVERQHPLSLLRLVATTWENWVPPRTSTCYEYRSYASGFHSSCVSLLACTKQQNPIVSQYAKWKLATNYSTTEQGAYWPAELGSENACRMLLAYYTRRAVGENCSFQRSHGNSSESCFLLSGDKVESEIILPTINDKLSEEERLFVAEKFFYYVHRLSGFRKPSYIYLLGCCYASGFGTAADPDAGQALKRYALSGVTALRKDVDAYLKRCRLVDALEVGRAHLHQREYFEANLWLRTAATNGQEEANYELAHMDRPEHSVHRHVSPYGKSSLIMKAALAGHTKAGVEVYLRVVGETSQSQLWGHLLRDVEKFAGKRFHFQSELLSTKFENTARAWREWCVSSRLCEPKTILATDLAYKVVQSSNITRHPDIVYYHIMASWGDFMNTSSENQMKIVIDLTEATHAGSNLARVRLALVLAIGTGHIAKDLEASRRLLIDPSCTLSPGFPVIQYLLAAICVVGREGIDCSELAAEELLDFCHLYGSSSSDAYGYL